MSDVQKISQEEAKQILMYKGYSSEEIDTVIADLFLTHSQIQKEQFYTVKEVANLFGITVPAVHKWIHQKKVEFIEENTFGGNKQYFLPKEQFTKTDTTTQKRLKLIQNLNKPVDINKNKLTIRYSIENELEEMGLEFDKN